MPRYSPPDSHSSLQKNQDGVWDGEQRAVANVASPIDAQDVATKQYVDEQVSGQRFVGTWSGATLTAMADPGRGKLRFNQATAAATTGLAISRWTDTDIDASQVFDRLLAGDTAKLQDKSDATLYARYTVSAPPVKTVDWYQIGLTLVDVSVPPLTLSNQDVLGVFEQTAAATRAAVLDLLRRGPQRYA